MVIYTIITILKQEEYVKIKNDFINNITHEIQTPITTISLASKTLINKNVIDNKQEVVKIANSIEKQSKRLISLVDNVLNLSVLKKKLIFLNLGNVNLHEIINNVIQNSYESKQIKNLNITTNLNAKNPVILADAFYIEMVLSNLVDNAIKYSENNVEINITTSENKNYLFFSVSDNGIGIHKQYQKHIFKQFYRVPTGNIYKTKGTGLGLYYVHLIIKSHKGRITLQSESGKGTSFLIKLKKEKTNG